MAARWRKDSEHPFLRGEHFTFGGESTCSLAALHYGIFMKKIASAKSFVMPEHLPPTESVSKFHSFSVYYQTMTFACGSCQL